MARAIIAIDLDNFYVGVERILDPGLCDNPVGIRQKGILATCSYEARALGVSKLMGLREAKDKCPQMIIVDGSDLTNYRIYSNKVFRLARAVLGDQVPVEKLGMDELFMDVSHLVDAHLSSLEHGEDKAEDGRRWFALKDEEGFWYDSQSVAGHAYPGPTSDQTPSSSSLTVPLDNIKMQLASHIALHVRSLILTRVGLTSSAGISPSKLLSKLLASVHKPADQTVLISPSPADDVQAFLDGLELRKLPGFGSKIVGSLLPLLPPDEQGRQPTKLNVALVLSSLTLADFKKVYTPRLAPILWDLLHGRDSSPVVASPEYPAQISTEDSFAQTINGQGGMRWSDFAGHLKRLLENLLRRLEDELVVLPSDTSPSVDVKGKGRETGGRSTPTTQWARYPHSLRLSLRRSWDAPASARQSKSTDLPSGVFRVSVPVAERVSDLFGGPDAKDGVGGVVGGLVKALLRKEWGKDGLQVYVINWAASSMSTSPPSAPDQTLSSFLNTQSSSKGRKRTVPDDFDLDMLDALPPDVRAEVVRSYGLKEKDLADARGERASKRPKTAGQASTEVIDLTSDGEVDGEGELWEEWPTEALDTAVEDRGDGDGSKTRCEECGQMVFAFSLASHQQFHETTIP